MIDPQDYLALNRELWNSKTPHHLASEFYGMKSFLDGRNTLNQVELELLGDVKGKSVLHLQCHFGMDTLSLSRLGAIATGVDFSETAILNAEKLAAGTNQDTRFICCDVYSLPENLDDKFDIVFTSYGTIGWLPDLAEWASIVSRYLKPGGTFVFVEFHPVVWMMDDSFKEVKYRYFNHGPIVEEENGTYADKNAPVKGTSVGWNHSLDEVISNLLSHELVLTSFKEYDFSPYNCFQSMIEDEPGKFRIKHLGNKIPLLYSICAKKNA